MAPGFGKTLALRVWVVWMWKSTLIQMISKTSGDLNRNHSMGGNAFSGRIMEAGMIPVANGNEALFVSLKIRALEMIKMNRKLFAVSYVYFLNL